MITVNGIAIAPERIFREMQYHPAPSKEEAEHNAAMTLVVGEVLRQRASALGLPQADIEQLETSAEQEELIEQLIELEVAIPQASRAECEAYFHANPQRFTTSPLLDISHILIAADPQDDVERVAAKEQAEALLLTLQRDPKAMARLAKAHSICSSSGDGGHLGQVTRGDTVAEFERIVFNATVGVLPYPVETRYGFHLVRVNRRVDGRLLPFAEVQDRIADYLNERVRRKAVAQYIEQLLANADISGLALQVSASPMMQ